MHYGNGRWGLIEQCNTTRKRKGLVSTTPGWPERGGMMTRGSHMHAVFQPSYSVHGANVAPTAVGRQPNVLHRHQGTEVSGCCTLSSFPPATGCLSLSGSAVRPRPRFLPPCLSILFLFSACPYSLPSQTIPGKP